MTSPPAVELLGNLVRKALKAGADAADALLVDSVSLSVGCRLGKIETLERSESGDMGLRVFVGKKQAMVSATDRKSSMQDELVARAVAMAKAAPEDEFCGLAEPDALAKNWPQLQLADTTEFSAEQLKSMAQEAEDAALSVKGVTNSEGADAGAGSAEISLVASNGFSGHYRRTSYSLSASVLAGDGTSMERDYDYRTGTRAKDLSLPSVIGKIAGERVVRRLGARKMPTGKVPVVFESRIAGSLLGQLASSISGGSVARGTSFLKDKLGQQIFSSGITIVDDPFREWGLRSRPFDAEGLLPQRRNIVDKGILTTWILDLRSARQLKMKSTAHAARSAGGAPSPSASNFYMEPGTQSFAELIGDIQQGFYVTELMGMGVNGVTGDYSQAAAGFWIEKGQIAFPVSEMTIAGNMKDMFLRLTPANDLEFKRGVDAPSLRIEGMMVAGV